MVTLGGSVQEFGVRAITKDTWGRFWSVWVGVTSDLWAERGHATRSRSSTGRRAFCCGFPRSGIVRDGPECSLPLLAPAAQPPPSALPEFAPPECGSGHRATSPAAKRSAKELADNRSSPRVRQRKRKEQVYLRGSIQETL